MPETSYVRSGDLHLAFQVLGDGPPDILPLDYWVSHVEAQWETPPLAALRERFASFGRVIMFDKRGSGLSDPVPTSHLPTLETWMDDAMAVLDAARSEKAVVIGNLAGGLLAMTMAAAHPERLTSLILVDCFARAQASNDFPEGEAPDFFYHLIDEIETTAGHGALLDLFAPSMADDPVVRRAWSRYERQATSPGSLKTLLRFISEGDVRAVLPAIRVPTLVFQRAEGRFGAPQGRYLAEHIAGSRYIELPGADKVIWAGDTDTILAEIQDFVTGVRPAPTTNRILATVLFTDIVGSTKLAAQMGDDRWRALLSEHFGVVRRQLQRFAGKEIKTIGDGMVATFDSPARALRSAVAIRDGARELGLGLRAGLHTGEIELEADDIAGLAVHIGARISAMAQEGEILVSSTVRDLVVGSGLVFQDRGNHELAGVPGDWRIYALAG